VHKTANVLNKVPKGVQPRMKKSLHEIWIAENREDAHRAFDLFVGKYEAKYPRAVRCLEKDRKQLLAFCDFPAEHWQQLRITNPIESTFATARGSRQTILYFHLPFLYKRSLYEDISG